MECCCRDEMQRVAVPGSMAVCCAAVRGVLPSRRIQRSFQPPRVIDCADIPAAGSRVGSRSGEPTREASRLGPDGTEL